MYTRSNFLIFDDDCCCHQSCWFHRDCCEQNWQKTCNCCPSPPHPPVPKPDPKPEETCDCQKIGIHASLQNVEAPIIEADEDIIFDTIVHQIGNEIDYNQTTGEFTIKKPGDYRISWHVIIGGTHAKRFASFGVKLDNELYHSFPLPVTTGLLASELILTTKKPNSVITLVNTTGDRVRLSRHLPNANIVITSV